jgi:hypothetical protein
MLILKIFSDCFEPICNRVDAPTVIIVYSASLSPPRHDPNRALLEVPIVAERILQLRGRAMVRLVCEDTEGSCLTSRRVVHRGVADARSQAEACRAGAVSGRYVPRASVVFFAGNTTSTARVTARRTSRPSETAGSASGHLQPVRSIAIPQQRYIPAIPFRPLR